MTLRRTVLILHTGALGDFVLTWPLALALGRLHPQSRIRYVAHASKGQLAEKALGVEWTDVEQGWHTLFAADAPIPAGVIRLLESAHSIYSFMSNGSDIWAERVAAAAPHAALVPLQPRPPHAFAGHATEYLLEQCGDAAVRFAIQQMLRSISDRGISTPRELSPHPIVIHPGSGSPQKCWPLDSYLQLAQQLIRDGYVVRFLLGEVEMDRWPQQQIREMSDCAPVECLENNLRLLKQLSAARLFIGNDSGPAHLAGIIGTPTLVLFGPTRPEVWRPLGPKVHVIRAEPLNALAVPAVEEAAARILKHSMTG